MKDLYKIYQIDKLDKYNRFFIMFDSLSKELELEVLPEDFKEDYLNDIEECDKELEDLDRDFGYVKIYKKKQKIFDNLVEARINKISFRVFKELEKNETLLSNLNSFKPYESYAKKVEYNQVKTITGRLVNKKSSPKILTLPSRHRKIFESRWQNDGELYQIDFRSLEPRVVRKINGKEAAEDIYLEIGNQLDFAVDRLIIKRAIISILYGSNSQIQGLSKERSDIVLEATKNYFDLKSIFEKASRIYESGCRRNFYGRPIWNIKEVQENKLINNYIQSTAVDVALIYFSELCDILNLDSCKPVFVIHDALIVDVKNEYVEELTKIINLGYNCPQLGNFPLEIKKLSETF